MTRAKDIRVEPITSRDAARVTAAFHYSHKSVKNSQLHLGVFLGGRCGGVMQFGPSMDKRKTQRLVRDTGWNGFLELNRMAFADWLPRNSESRALGVAMRTIRREYPHVEWVVSFADGTQCGDGTIYRASGFVLTGIKKSTAIVEFPDGTRESRLTLTSSAHAKGETKLVVLARKWGVKLGGGASTKPFLDIGARLLPGFQLRYVYFLNPDARARLTVPELPFTEIARMGATMYRGVAGAAQADHGSNHGGGCDSQPPASPEPARG